jgi:predicted aconitase with swiveling domain
MGFDVQSGRISDVHSPAAGESVVGRVLVMPTGRGSSSASTALAEAVRLGTAPAAIILGETDEILVVGAIVARTLYERSCPIVLVGRADLRSIRTGDRVAIDADGSVIVTSGMA